MPDPTLWQRSMSSATGALGRNLGGPLGAHRAELRRRGLDAHGWSSMIMIDLNWSLSNYFGQRGCPECGPHGVLAAAAWSDTDLDEHGSEVGTAHFATSLPAGGETTASPGTRSTRVLVMNATSASQGPSGRTTGRTTSEPASVVGAVGAQSWERGKRCLRPGTAVVDGDMKRPSRVGVRRSGGGPSSFAGVPWTAMNDAAMPFDQN